MSGRILAKREAEPNSDSPGPKPNPLPVTYILGELHSLMLYCCNAKYSLIVSLYFYIIKYQKKNDKMTQRS